MKKVLAVAGTAVAAYTLLAPIAANAANTRSGERTAAVAPSTHLSVKVNPMSATGFQSIGSFSYSLDGISISIPAGCLLGHTIKGDGKKLDSEFAGWTCAPPASSYLDFNEDMCNPRIDFIYRDTNNKIYSRYTSKTKYGCWGASGPDFDAPNNRTLAHYGTACAAMYLNGQYKAQQCHNITP